jgi:hypothetical protein
VGYEGGGVVMSHPHRCETCKRHTILCDEIDRCSGFMIINSQWDSIRKGGCPAWERVE